FLHRPSSTRVMCRSPKSIGSNPRSPEFSIRDRRVRSARVVERSGRRGYTSATRGGFVQFAARGARRELGQEVVDDVRSGVLEPSAGKVADLTQVVTAGEDRLLHDAAVTYLTDADVGHEGVAEALPADGIVELATLFHVG